MSDTDFEKLVCEWLDDPQNADLGARIEQAVRRDPSLAAVLANWRRFDAHLRAALPAARGINWDTLRQRISQAVDRATQHEELALDTALRRLPTLEGRVDWARLHQRIAAAVPGRRRWQVGLRFGLGVISVAGLAAAAALVVSVLPDFSAPPVSRGLVHVSVGISAPTPVAGTVAVRVSVPEGGKGEPERFYCVDPVRQSASADDVVGYY